MLVGALRWRGMKDGEPNVDGRAASGGTAG